MELVQPIRDKEKIEQMKNELLKTGYRDYMLFVIGVNTGLRISDILALTVGAVRNKTHINIKEQKTGKDKRVMINSYLKRDVDKYIQGMNDDEYLFRSRKGENNLLPGYRLTGY